MKSDGLHVLAALVFLTSAAVTVVWCGSMSDMPGMDMPGGWTMSMAWMRMPGQSWWNAGLQFLGMWAVMMVAMMMPVLLPALVRQRKVQPRVQAARLTAGYFTVWIAAGGLLFPVGVGFAALAMNNPALSAVVPWVDGAVLLAAGLIQFSGWKARQLQAPPAATRAGFRVPAGIGPGMAVLPLLRGAHGGAAGVGRHEPRRHGGRRGGHCLGACRA